MTAHATGRLVYIAGNDGTGKTTQAELLLTSLRALGIPSQYVWLRYPQYLSLPVLGLSRLLRVTRYETVDGRRVGRWEFHRARWLASLLLWCRVVDARIARRRLIEPLLRRGETVVLDRFVYDIAVDVAAAANDPGLLCSRAARLMYGLVRREDAVILDAPAATIRTRRSGLSLDFGLAMRAELYRSLGAQVGVVLCDASQPRDVVHQKLLGAVRP
jgi:thymidylate kinase